MATERSNDEQLDDQIKNAFSAEALQADAAGPASEALLDQVLEASSVPVLDGAALSAGAATADPVFDESVIDGRLAPAQSRPLLLVAAAVTFIAVLGIAVWSMQRDDPSPLLSDDAVAEGGAEEDLPDADADPNADSSDIFELIVGPGTPAITLLADGLVDRQAAVSACRRQFGVDPIGGQPAVGSGSLLHALILDGTATVPEVLILDDGSATTTCGSGDIGSSWGRVLLDVPSASNPLAVASVGTSTSPRWVVVQGKLATQVDRVRLVDADFQEQSFRRSGLWFRIDGSLPGDASLRGDWTVEVTMADGSVTTMSVEQLIENEEQFVCAADAECVAQRISEAAEQAREAGSTRQHDILADAQLSQSEYTAALGRFEDCLADAGVEPGASVAENSREGVVARACHHSEIAHIEVARRWQNHFVSIPLIDAEADIVGDADEPDTPSREDVISDGELESMLAAHIEVMKAEATLDLQALFINGLSREELGELWTGYPYGFDEKDRRIEQFQTEFAWIQSGEIDIEVNFYSQFGDAAFEQPTVTVQAESDRSKAAVFVLGVSSDGVLSVGRLPELEDGPGDAMTSQIWARDEGSITIQGVGVEGGVSAFANGKQLETDSDHTTWTTKIFIPQDLPLPAIVTVVAATPELPAARVLRIDPFTDEPIVLDESNTDCYAVGTHRLAEDATLYQVEPNFDDENPGLDQETNQIQLFAVSELEIAVTTESAWLDLDLDADGIADTLQRLEVIGRNGELVAEGYRVCGTATPTRSLWNDPAEGPLVVLADMVDGVEFPRGGLIVGSDELAGRLPGQETNTSDHAWVFDDDGLLIRLSEALAAEIAGN